jgi:hypothetical protein
MGRGLGLVLLDQRLVVDGLGRLVEEASLFLTWAETGGMAMDGERDEEGEIDPASCDARGAVSHCWGKGLDSLFFVRFYSTYLYFLRGNEHIPDMNQQK